jgi:hypothetical protein
MSGIPTSAPGRARRLRRLGIVGTLAAVGVFSGLAAAGGDGADRSSSAAAAETPSADPAGETQPSIAEDDYFEAPAGGAVGPDNSSGPPLARSGAS